MNRLLSISVCLGLIGGLALSGIGTARDEQASQSSSQPPEPATSHLGSALSGAFKQNTVRAFPGTAAPGARGLMQQSVWQFPKLRKHIQLAFVLDATNSMNQDIDSLKASLESVIEHLRGQVSEVRSEQDVKVQVAIVVYRDWWRQFDFDKRQLLERRDSPVEVLTKGSGPGTSFLDFDRNLLTLLDQLKGIPLEWGHPGPEEQVDLGVAKALQDLDWMKTDKVSRLIVVAGDNPPWSEEYLDWKKNPEFWTYWEQKQPNPQPLRKYSTGQLIEMARQNDVKIFAMACSTIKEVSDEQRKLRGRMRGFFQQLADGTDGKFLDLTDADTVASLKRAVQSGGSVIQQLRDIKEHEITEQKQRSPEAQARIAVLPPIKIVDYQHAYEDDVYVVAKLLTKQLQDIDPALASSGDQVQRAWLNVSPDGQVSAERLAQVATELRANYIVWGDMQPANGNLELALKLYDANGRLVVEASYARGNLLNVPELAWKQLLKQAEDVSEATSFSSTFQRLAISTSLAQSPESLRELMWGYSKLEEAVRFTSDEPEGQKLIDEATVAFQNVLSKEPDSVFASLMLASCQLNRNQNEAAKSTLATTRRLAQSLPEDDPLRWEIEADHAWVVNSDYTAAIKGYRRILESTEAKHSRIALRAHWMLAGLMLGTVPREAELVPDSIKRLDEARKHILAILVNWPETTQARFYGRYVDPLISPRTEPAGPTRVVDVERRIAVPLPPPKRLLGGW